MGTDAVEGSSLLRPQNHRSIGVIHLLYLCAYILSPGSTIFGIVEEANMDHLWPQFIDDAADDSIFPKDLVQLFFGGVDKEVIDKALPDLVRFPMSALTTTTKGSAWRSVPATYVYEYTQQDCSVLTQGLSRYNG